MSTWHGSVLFTFTIPESEAETPESMLEGLSDVLGNTPDVESAMAGADIERVEMFTGHAEEAMHEEHAAH